MKKMLSFFVVFIILILIGIVSINLISLKYSSYTNPKIDKDLTLTPLSLATSTTSTIKEQPTPPKLPSRVIFEMAENIIKEKKSSPTVAARFYAYVATAYSDTLQLTKNSEMAQSAVREIIRQIYPDQSTSTLPTPLTNSTSSLQNPASTSSFSNTIESNTTSLPAKPLPTTSDFIKDLLEREKNDGFYSLVWDEKIPPGKGKWKNTSHATPITPRAGEWQRWIVPGNTNFSVAIPPAVGSPEYQQEIDKIIAASTTRTSEQEKIILVWDMGPGTETVSGLWQDKLWENFQKQNPSFPSNSDLKYAYLQKILAQGMADTLLESWKIKFTYWTARPEMVIKNFKPFVSTPSSPSYISEQAATSRTAAEILATFFPNQQNIFIKDAEFNRDASMWSGINFDIDAKEGYKLGEQIGKEVIKHIGIIE